MSAATVSTNGQHQRASELREAARDAYRASLVEASPLTGAALARLFGMSERWGRDRIAEVQRHGSQTDHRRRLSTGGETAAVAQDERTSDTRLAEPETESAATAAGDDAEGNRGPAGRPWLDTVIILAVALVAAAASYGHMLEVATLAGEPVWIARAFPVTVDGLALAALRRGRQGRWWLGLAVAVSVAANVVSRYPELAVDAGPVVSAWPPLALFGTHRLLHARSTRS